MPAEINILPSNDPRSYSVCSDKSAGHRLRSEAKTLQTAVREIVAAYRDGRLKDEPISYNVHWMKQHNFG